MIKIIREGSQKYPWILKTLMLVIAVTFVIGMGWWGFEASQPNIVATVGPYKITFDEYRRAYQRAYRFYRDQLKQEDVDEDTLKKLVLQSLMENKIWTIAADRFGIDVSAKELHDVITSQPEFQKDGTFNPQYYQRLLAANRLTPAAYERRRRAELIADKARLLVMESTTLTPEELQEVEELAKRRAGDGKEPDAALIEQVRSQFLMQKKQRALQAFQAALLASLEVETNDALL